MMNKHSKIYVAGHNGLVGSSLLRKLNEKGYKNLVFRTAQELDLRCQQDTELFFRKERPEYVFLAAAKVGGILANSTYTAEFIYDNIMIAANVINFSYKFGVKKLLNLGSSCIYPRASLQPMKEKYLLTGQLEPTNEPYAVAKIAAIKLCRYYNEQYKTNFISAMPTNLYGCNDNFNLETAHLPAALMRKFYLAQLLKEGKYQTIKEDISRCPLGFDLDNKIDKHDINSIKKVLKNLGITKDYVRLWGTGSPYREFLYVDDLSNACLFLMTKYDYKDIGEVINIGSGKDQTIRQMALLIKNIIGFSGKIIWDKTKPNGMPKKLLDVSKIISLGWAAKTSLTAGLKKMIDYYIKDYGRN